MAGATFFEHQQLARRNTRVMVVLFLLAVAAIVSAVDLVLGALYVFLLNDKLGYPGYWALAPTAGATVCSAAIT